MKRNLAAGRSDENRAFNPVFMAAIAFLLLACIGYAFSKNAGAGPVTGYFVDTDDATRAMRVLALMQGQAWFDPLLHLVGPGLESHWTRPSDLIVLAGAIPLHLIGYDAKTAILLTSYVTPWILLVAFLGSWIWATKPLARPGSIDQAMLALAPLVGVRICSWFEPMRIDHHAMIATCCVILAGLAVRFHRRDQTTWREIATGIFVGGAIWVGIEEILFVGAFFVCAGAAWVLSGDRYFAAKNLRVSIYAALAMFVCMLLERGFTEAIHPSFSYDKISLLHVLAMVGVVAGWKSIMILSLKYQATEKTLRDLLSRSLMACFGGAIAVLVIYVFQPMLITGHLDSSVDHTYAALRLHNIGEGMPVYSSYDAKTRGLALALLFTGGLLFAPLVGLLGFVVTGLQKDTWRYRLCFLLFVSVFLVVQLGWKGIPTYYNSIWMAIFGLAGIGIGVGRLASLISGRYLLQALLGTVAMIGLFGAEVGMLAPSPAIATTDASRAYAGCDDSAAIASLEKAGIGTGDTVLAFSDIGPEVMWQTGARVLSIPNHHYQPGFLAAHQFLAAKTDAEALQVAVENKVTAAVICRVGTDDAFTGLRDEDGDTFSKRVLKGSRPAWTDTINDTPGALVLRILPSK